MLMHLPYIDYFRQLNMHISPQLISFLFAALNGRNIKYITVNNLDCTCEK